MSEKRYRTIVADPPWPGNWWPGGGRKSGVSSGGKGVYAASAPSYELMTLEDICSVPVADWVEEDAHLYLWVPDPHLVEGNAAQVARAWGFKPGRLIVWRKRNPGMGAFPAPAHEAVLVCSRGSLPFTVTGEQSVQDWPQPYWKGRKIHSAKPDAFLDLVERASPPPRLEMFARRARLSGWDYWGDESLGTAEMAVVLEGQRG